MPAPDGDDRLTVAALPTNKATAFRLEPDQAARAALAEMLDAQSVRKLRFEGTVRPDGKDAWRLDATLGATVVQTCTLTLDPVTTRIDAPVTRRFVPPQHFETQPGAESEIPEDDTLEPLGQRIDLAAIMAEALALELPDFPRRPDAELGSVVHAAPGVTPMTDEDAKPFAGLAALRDRLEDDDPGQTH